MQLEAHVRQDMSKSHLKALRREGRVPASLYGKGKPAMALELVVRSLALAVHTEAGMHAVLEVKVHGGKKGDGGTAVIKSLQKDPITRRVLQVDLERVAMSDVIHTSTSVLLRGASAGVKEGGLLEQMLDDLEIKCRADHIPAHVEVDITDLKMGDFVHASDVILPEGVELATRPDDIVVAVRHPHLRAQEEAEEAAAEAEAAASAEEEKSATEESQPEG